MNRLAAFISLCAVAAGLCACGGNQEGYIIEGQADGDGYAVLHIFHPDKETVRDTVALKNGKFVFKGSVEDVFMGDVVVCVEGKEPVRYSLYPENAHLVLRDGHFVGGPNNDFALAMDAAGDSVDPQAPDYHEQLIKAMNACFAAHPDVEAAAFFYNAFNRETPLEEFEAGFNLFTERVQNSLMGRNGREEILSRKATMTGIAAPAFTLNDRSGNPVSLESLRGQYVLLDFWASWCRPCRESMPHMKEVYALYKDKGLVILGISTDSKAADWIKAIDEDATPWTHVLDDKDVATVYGVHAVPTLFLIDPEGVMVGKIEHEDLDDTLQRLL